MDLHLKNKIIIISGGAKGIGKSTAVQLVEEGATPVLLDKDEKAGQDFKKEFSNSHFISLDLNDSFACKKAVEDVEKRFGRIDGLVNNAGFNDDIGLEKGTPDKFIQSLNNNSGHYYHLAHYSLPHLKKSKGSIVNIASKVAITGQGNTSGYAAAKGAILSLTREWAVELLPFSIRVNAVVPAQVITPLYEYWLSTYPDPAAKKLEIEKMIPLGARMTTSEEIANTIVFLLSDRSSHTTGQWVYVDGGYVHLNRVLS
jgi:L-fucose dehydrogenase